LLHNLHYHNCGGEDGGDDDDDDTKDKQVWQ
jgi:hypothetical protein